LLTALKTANEIVIDASGTANKSKRNNMSCIDTSLL